MFRMKELLNFILLAVGFILVVAGVLSGFGAIMFTIYSWIQGAGFLAGSLSGLVYFIVSAIAGVVGLLMMGIPK